MKKKFINRLRKMAQMLPDQFTVIQHQSLLAFNPDGTIKTPMIDTQRHKTNHVRRMKRAFLREGWKGVKRYIFNIENTISK